MNRSLALWMSTLPLLGAGCQTLNLDILLRDEIAIKQSVADTLMTVVDESSAKYFLDVHAKRFKSRVEAHKKRVEMYVKYANDDDKKRMKEFIDAMGKAAADGGKSLTEDSFDTFHLFRRASELIASDARIKTEFDRSKKVLTKLAEIKAFEVQEEWRAAGRAGSPIIGVGRDVDPKELWPSLYKFSEEAYKELGLEKTG